MVKEGCVLATSIDPLRYLQHLASDSFWAMSLTHPIAYVLQSLAGASAVMGSKMVRAEICSEVEGSKSMTLPLTLPAHCQSVVSPCVIDVLPTKGNVAVAHPHCDSNVLVCRKASNLASRVYVPDNCSISRIVAYSHPT